MNMNLIIQTKHTMYSFQITLIYALQKGPNGNVARFLN